jgi:hypothetical protein
VDEGEGGEDSSGFLVDDVDGTTATFLSIDSLAIISLRLGLRGHIIDRETSFSTIVFLEIVVL